VKSNKILLFSKIGIAYGIIKGERKTCLFRGKKIYRTLTKKGWKQRESGREINRRERD